MFKKALFALSFLIIPAGLLFAQEAKVEFEGRYWISDLDAKVKAVESDIGSDFDLKSDLGLKDESFPEGRAIWHTGPNSKLRFAYTQVNYSGDENISRSVEFEGRTYTAGTRVVTDLDIMYLRFGWIWQFINLLQEKIKLGTIIEVKGVQADVSLDAPSLGFSESRNFLGGLPTVGAALDINPIKKVNLFAEVSGISAGDYGYLYDAEAGIKIMPFKNWSIFGGYRIIDFKVENDPDYAKIKIAGPFVGATLRF